MNRPALVKFAKHMEAKLKENDRKGKTGWKRWSHQSMLCMLQQEVNELVIALHEDNNIRAECCDIANFAMMIFDNEDNK